jgi:hypothetical protein
VHERQCQVQLLFGSAGKRSDRLSPVSLVAELLDELVGPPQAGDVVGGAEVVEVLVDGEGVVEDDLLRTVPHRVAAQHGATARAQIARQDTQQGGLAGAVLANDAGERARGDLEADAPQHLVAPVGLVQLLRLQKRV